MSHFKNNKTKPLTVVMISYIYVFIVSLLLYFSSFYETSTFFNWGLPLKFFGKELKTEKEFYILLFLIFIHQLINNYVNSVVYPWIINSVQDPKNKKMEYSTFISLIIINLFDLYSQLDVIFIVTGFATQISFVCVISIANLLSSSFINYEYLKNKEHSEYDFINIV